MGGTIFSHPPYRLLLFFIFCSIGMVARKTLWLSTGCLKFSPLNPPFGPPNVSLLCQERGVTKSEPSPPHGRGMGGEGATPLTAPPPAPLGKVRRKWAEGARPAADSQPQGVGVRRWTWAGMGLRVPVWIKPLAPSPRTPRGDSVSPAEDGGIIPQLEGSEPGRPSLMPAPAGPFPHALAGFWLSQDTLRGFRSGSCRPRPS